MPLILSTVNNGRRDVLIILGPVNIERIKEKDPFELRCWELPSSEPIGVVAISYAGDAELMQMEQLVRQGKVNEAIERATSGFKYRPDLGDHDLGPQRLN